MGALSRNRVSAAQRPRNPRNQTGSKVDNVEISTKGDPKLA